MPVKNLLENIHKLAPLTVECKNFIDEVKPEEATLTISLSKSDGTLFTSEIEGHTAQLVAANIVRSTPEVLTEIADMAKDMAKDLEIT